MRNDRDYYYVWEYYSQPRFSVEAERNAYHDLPRVDRRFSQSRQLFRPSLRKGFARSARSSFSHARHFNPAKRVNLPA